MKTLETSCPANAPVAPMQGISPPWLPQSAKILATHREKLAIVYVRQSSPQQVLDHRESAARQYALVDCAVARGWPRDSPDAASTAIPRCLLRRQGVSARSLRHRAARGGNSTTCARLSTRPGQPGHDAELVPTDLE